MLLVTQNYFALNCKMNSEYWLQKEEVTPPSRIWQEPQTACQDNWCPARDSNPAPPENKIEANLLVQPGIKQRVLQWNFLIVRANFLLHQL
jgi:hypothetical protein